MSVNDYSIHMGDVLRRRKMNNRGRGVILKEASFMTSGQSLIDNIGHQSRQNNRIVRV